MDQPPSRDRRGALKWLTAALGTTVGALVAVPGLGMLLRPGRSASPGVRSSIKVGFLRSLTDGEPQLARLTGTVREAWSRQDDVVLGACWLVRHGTSVRAFSNVCPHLGCGIQWDATTQRFSCPCHTSAFTPDGERMAGPSPRGMDELHVDVIGDEIHVRFERFRLGSARKETIG